MHQLGKSNFLKTFIKSNFKISNYCSFRKISSLNKSYIESCLLIPPKERVFFKEIENLDVRFGSIILVSSMAPKVISNQNENFIKYKKDKTFMESYCAERSKKLTILRFAMFVSIRNLRSIMIFLLAYILRPFARKDTSFFYTLHIDISTKMQILMGRENIICRELKGLGLFSFNLKVLDAALEKIYVETKN